MKVRQRKRVMERHHQKNSENELVDAFGRVFHDVKFFAMPAQHSLAGGEALSKHWKARRG
jgi:hypothetical protein